MVQLAMPTKIFISWSGELSRKLATEVANLIPAVIQSVETYFTPEDVAKGARWEAEIARQLDECQIGIICLTNDNLVKPWILFEAGALSKAFDKSRVCTVLFDVDPADITPPLSIFQHTKYERGDFRKLFQTINDASIDVKLKDVLLDKSFDMYWPTFEAPVTEILKNHPKSEAGARRPDREIVEEILELSRNNAVNGGDILETLISISTRLSRLTDAFAPEQLPEIAKRNVMHTTFRSSINKSAFRKRTVAPSEIERLNRIGESQWVRHSELPVEKVAEIIRSSRDVDTVIGELIKVAKQPKVLEELQAALAQKNAQIQSEINSARFHLELEPLNWQGQSPAL